MGSARFELATYGLRDAAPGLGMGVDLIPLSIKSSTYENSTELDRKCPKPAASSIAINCAIKWRPSDPTILSPAKAVSGTQIGRCRASGTRKNCGHRPCWHPYGRLARLLYLGASVRGRGLAKVAFRLLLLLQAISARSKFFNAHALCQKQAPQSLRAIHRPAPTK